eukprot:g26320.t1
MHRWQVLQPQNQDGVRDGTWRCSALLVAKERPDRLDYSRTAFKDIGQEDREERLQTGDVTWEELKSDEKKQEHRMGWVSKC